MSPSVDLVHQNDESLGKRNLHEEWGTFKFGWWQARSWHVQAVPKIQQAYDEAPQEKLIEHGDSRWIVFDCIVLSDEGIC